MIVLLDKSEMAVFKMFTAGGISKAAAMVHISENSEVEYEALEDYEEGVGEGDREEVEA